MYPYLSDWRRKFAWWPVEVYEFTPGPEFKRKIVWLGWYEEKEVKEEYFGFTPFPGLIRRAIPKKYE